MGQYDKFAVERNKTPVTADHTLHCPFCDDWKLGDSMVARKRLGVHIASYHNFEVSFHRGEQPPSLVEEKHETK